jgi:hypothetical protein
MDWTDKLGPSSAYAFGIVCEAKVRSLVIMTKRVHPDWGDEQIIDFLKSAIDYAVKKEVK